MLNLDPPQNQTQRNGSVSNPSWQKEVIRECAKTWVKTGNGNPADEPEDEETSDQEVPFEMVVLDNALNATTTKFNQNFCRMKPIFNKLIEYIFHK